MNGVREEYSIKVKQSSKGIWYCDGLQVISEKVTGLKLELDSLMTQIEEVLTEHNYVEKPNAWEKGVKRHMDAEEKKKVEPVDAGGEK